MRNIIFAVAMTVATSAILFLLSTAVGLPADVAKGMAGLPAFAIKNIYEFLETQTAKRTLASTNSIVSFEEFSMHPVSAFILAVIMYIGVLNLTGMVSGFFIGVALSHKVDWLHSDPNLLLL